MEEHAESCRRRHHDHRRIRPHRRRGLLVLRRPASRPRPPRSRCSPHPTSCRRTRSPRRSSTCTPRPTARGRRRAAAGRRCATSRRTARASCGIPTKNPKLVDPETIELTSPAFGQRDVAAIESDLTLQHAGEPLGERMTVQGRLLDSWGRPLANQLIELWQANAAGPLHPPARPASRPARPELHRRRPRGHERRRRVPVHDDQAGRRTRGRTTSTRGGPRTSTSRCSARLHAARRDADVLPGRPAVPARPDLQHDPPPGRPRPAHRRLRPRPHACPSSRRATGSTSSSTARMPRGSSPKEETTDAVDRLDDRPRRPTCPPPARRSARSSPSESTTPKMHEVVHPALPGRDRARRHRVRRRRRTDPRRADRDLGRRRGRHGLARARRVPPRRPHLHRLRPRRDDRRRPLRVLDAQPRAGRRQGAVLRRDRVRARAARQAAHAHLPPRGRRPARGRPAAVLARRRTSALRSSRRARPTADSATTSGCRARRRPCSLPSDDPPGPGVDAGAALAGDRRVRRCGDRMPRSSTRSSPPRSRSSARVGARRPGAGERRRPRLGRVRLDGARRAVLAVTASTPRRSRRHPSPAAIRSSRSSQRSEAAGGSRSARDAPRRDQPGHPRLGADARRPPRGPRDLGACGETEPALAASRVAHRDQVAAARTLTQHAVPTTVGLRAANWLRGVRARDRCGCDAAAAAAARAARRRRRHASPSFVATRSAARAAAAACPPPSPPSSASPRPRRPGTRPAGR